MQAKVIAAMDTGTPANAQVSCLSVPRRDQFGHMRLRSLLAREAFDPVFRGAPLLAQFSSMGSITSAWLNEVKASLAAGRVEGGGECRHS